MTFGVMITTLLAACSSEAPNKEEVAASIKKIMPVNFEVLEINKLTDIPGLFEVVVNVGKQPVVFYIDKKAKYVVSGSIVAVDTKKNLTLETQKKFARK